MHSPSHVGWSTPWNAQTIERGALDADIYSLMEAHGINSSWCVCFLVASTRFPRNLRLQSMEISAQLLTGHKVVIIFCYIQWTTRMVSQIVWSRTMNNANSVSGPLGDLRLRVWNYTLMFALGQAACRQTPKAVRASRWRLRRCVDMMYLFFLLRLHAFTSRTFLGLDSKGLFSKVKTARVTYESIEPTLSQTPAKLEGSSLAMIRTSLHMKHSLLKQIPIARSTGVKTHHQTTIHKWT